MPFDGKYSESLPYWRIDDIVLPSGAPVIVQNALSYYNRVRVFTNPFNLFLISPDCRVSTVINVAPTVTAQAATNITQTTATI